MNRWRFDVDRLQALTLAQAGEIAAGVPDADAVLKRARAYWEFLSEDEPARQVCRTEEWSEAGMAARSVPSDPLSPLVPHFQQNAGKRIYEWGR
jgi:hypothetical protein